MSRKTFVLPDSLVAIMKFSNTYIIDAFNVIHADPHLRTLLNVDVKTAIDQCLSMVHDFCATRKVSVQLVFDGQAPSRRAQSPKLTVIYAGANTNADEVIISLVRRNRNPRSITVVSSDNHVVSITKTLGAHPLSSHGFLHLLEKAKRKAVRKKKENPRLSESEIEEWLKEFSE